MLLLRIIRIRLYTKGCSKKNGIVRNYINQIICKGFGLKLNENTNERLMRFKGIETH